VMALDLLGFGLSDKPLLAYRVTLLSDVLAEFFRKASIERAAVVGNSMGGWVAAWFAITYPALTSKLVLLNAIGLESYRRSITPDLTAALRQSTKADLRMLGHLAYYDPSQLTETVIDDLFAARLRAADGYTVNQLVDSLARGEDTLDAHLGRLASPTAVIWGSADQLVPSRFAHEFHHAIVASELHMIEKCGHMPHMECPASLVPILREFLKVPTFRDARQ
jgi:pimeloyl-ACP methyl ester carboxylesterase